MENEEENVSSYCMTLRKREDSYNCEATLECILWRIRSGIGFGTDRLNDDDDDVTALW